ncbi:hypothetical protein LINGRAHAP2_LOCUS35437, partial [Linum grandiflorum]
SLVSSSPSSSSSSSGSELPDPRTLDFASVGETSLQREAALFRNNSFGVDGAGVDAGPIDGAGAESALDWAGEEAALDGAGAGDELEGLAAGDGLERDGGEGFGAFESGGAFEAGAEGGGGGGVGGEDGGRS